ncbi:6-chlorohydroxyquinol-1,2-dioxygenase [Bradyrhizobium sp. SSBR45G]|uniref:dioxygenase family protein n=1 Tax=unclassified Bradyrhizobium TaxID=2631580 RepID=UPI002342B177|nr:MULTISPECIES: dioxygenase [unclassified Bradyrhizobium]GLH79062.1 6-chlorohydroxyquinol-1,2-dioxygenase [Bradyrhizobium sp. SSBR45G]GLH86615.1 6-chlorohydroxyquinol-1,2-dioxygenase [Bradyrhizobium sp. SSBR45R]
MRQELPIDRDGERSSDVVTERIARVGSGRLATGMIAVVDHIHQLIRELRPTRAEWREAMAYLAAVGDATTDNRQEWVLLADLIGATALVEDINSRRPPGATPNAPRGPFYRADAPRRANGANICLDGIGEPLVVQGRVVDLDGHPIAGAVVETWQANGQGFFENQQPDEQPDCNLRGVFTTDANGSFNYVTVKPASYAVPTDGPAGALLGRLGCPLRRPANIHFIVSADGFEQITTQLFDRAEAAATEDALHCVKPGLLADFQRTRRKDVPWSLSFSFVMARAPKTRSMT